MHLKSILYFLLLIGCSHIASAQEAKQEQPAKKGCSCSFSSINQLGMLAGKWGEGPLLQSVNGIRYKTWFAGVGVGVDVYQRGTFPVFLDVRKDLLKKRNTPFIYGDAGMHFPDKKVVSENQWYESEYTGGFYSDAGVGYRMGRGKRGGVVFSTGYSYKRLDREYRAKQNVCDFCNLNRTTYTNYLHRVSVKIGWQL